VVGAQLETVRFLTPEEFLLCKLKSSYGCGLELKFQAATYNLIKMLLWRILKICSNTKRLLLIYKLLSREAKARSSGRISDWWKLL
jgi:hypothetical protein